MGYIETFNFWKKSDFFDEETKQELMALDLIKDQKEIEDRFYCDLNFGTGGLRGIMGAGTNRINKYTVGRTTTGLGNYLLDKYGFEECSRRGVVVGYDTRNNSKFFAQITANVLSRMGIQVYLHSHACPTPQLSYAIKYWNALTGVVLTASHNPKEYNGYKVYDEYGCQLVPWQAKEVIEYVNKVTDYSTINFNGNQKLISIVDETDDFVTAVLKQNRYQNVEAKADLKVVYTPLHGTGYKTVKKILLLDGFSNVEYVKEQVVPDGDFPTVITPNPEDKEALQLGIIQAMKNDADIVIGTDPDCDRMGIAVRTENGYQLMTGNQIGALLTDYILTNTNLEECRHPAILKTIVSSDLGAQIAAKKGVKVFSTLTGFKYIGEKITQFEEAKMEKNSSCDYDFIFGYEESYGYLAGTHSRDKDANVSCMLICEMAAELKVKNKTLVDRMNEIYKEFGYYYDEMKSYTFERKDGLEKISSIMSALRSNDHLFENIKEVVDYSISSDEKNKFEKLPTSNVLKFFFKNGSWIAVRPSGTEPKIKFYYSIRAYNRDKALKQFDMLRNVIESKLGLED